MARSSSEKTAGFVKVEPISGFCDKSQQKFQELTARPNGIMIRITKFDSYVNNFKIKIAREREKKIVYYDQQALYTLR